MSPSTLFPLSDITTNIGYNHFVRKLRLLEIERAGAELRSAAGVPDLKGLEWHSHPKAPAIVSPHDFAKAAYARNSRNTENVQHLLSILKGGAVPSLSRSSSHSSDSSLANKITVHDIAAAAYKRNSRNTENVQFLLSILNNGIPPSLSMSLSKSSASSLGESTPETLDDCELLNEGWERAEQWVGDLVDDE
ncbi:hypothetical protein AURDEDRAFT_155922 [Auricularia subglabra TFB-10046 SS5]|nr:hypothetical protein AURDEDRAFT_155922 [Auricularia subglabra TFB-10046 SS5]